MGFDNISGQVALLTIAGVGSFGVTKVEPKRSYVNADTTVTQNNWEQFCPIVRGAMLDVSVPLSSNLSQWIDDAFDAAEFDAGPTINGLTCSLSSLPAAGETFSGEGLIENYSVVYDSKDAARLVFSIRFTGEVTA
jgi:hypothetical protein